MKALVGVIVTCGLLVVAGCSSDTLEPPAETNTAAAQPGALRAAYDACRPAFETALQDALPPQVLDPAAGLVLVNDDTTSLTIQTADQPAVTEPVARDLVECLLTETEAPPGTAIAFGDPSNEQASLGWPGIGFSWTVDAEGGLFASFLELPA